MLSCYLLFTAVLKFCYAVFFSGYLVGWEVFLFVLVAEGVCIVPNFLNTYTFCLTLTALLTNTQTNKAGQRPSTLNLSATTAALQVSSLPSLVPPFPPSCNDLPNVCCVIAQNLPVFFVFFVGHFQQWAMYVHVWCFSEEHKMKLERLRE